ncbi:ATP-dependent helicase [Candidatus Microgenomates bacterium]|nr:MAG: ATP-dependent helicase [Candidatus Microgenomates bacterium]
MDQRKLNIEQEQAVLHSTGPLLVVAGAGTGKTTVITERIKHLVISDLAKPEEILALTFTEKASAEMQNRVDEALPYGYSNMWISTFHSFCDRVLRAEALQIGLSTNFKLMTEAESVKLFRDNLFEFSLDYFRPLGSPNKFVSAILKHFSRLQDENISPNEYVAWAKKHLKSTNSKNKEKLFEAKKWKELADAYATYDKIKIRENVFDFGDLIAKTLLLFNVRPNVLSEYQKKFKYVLVDEFQDTNFAQNELSILLAGKNGNITVVGDDDQSIYRFRGASVSNILQFKNTYKNAKVVVLNKNYRSHQNILDASYKLINFNNPDRLEVRANIDKKLVSLRKTQENNIHFLHSKNGDEEALGVASEISKLVENDGYVFSDIAILARANNHVDAFARVFERAGIPFQFLGPAKLMQQREISDLIAYLKVVCDKSDSSSLMQVLSMNIFSVPAETISSLGSWARKHNKDLFSALVWSEDMPEGTSKKVSRIIKMINKDEERSFTVSAGKILYDFLFDTGLVEKYFSTHDPRVELQAKNIAKFFDKLKSFENNNQLASPRAVVDWLSLLMELGESPLAAEEDWVNQNAVRLMTVHSAKGLEFPIVFLVNLVGLRFPGMNRSETIPIPDGLVKETLPSGDFHLQEERRLFYVGMTRAKDKLYLTAADFYNDGARPKKLSQFIFECLGDNVAAAEETSGEKQLSLFEYSNETTSEIKPEPHHVHYLSYSQISTFKFCPLHYKLAYILRLPTEPTAAQSIGVSIHAALAEFYLLHQKGDKLNKKILLSLLNKNWETLGFADKKHEDLSKKHAQALLSNYYDKQYNLNDKVLEIEKNFLIPLQYNYEKIKIGGKIDLVNRANSGIEIIDYKTGSKIPSQKEIDQDLQLTFYALAATKIKEEPFNLSPEKIKLSLYYLDEGIKISTTRTKADLDNTIAEIFDYKHQIENSNFTCSGHPYCQSCEYATFCRNES